MKDAVQSGSEKEGLWYDKDSGQVLLLEDPHKLSTSKKKETSSMVHSHP
jgi:hypothetical protein